MKFDGMKKKDKIENQIDMFCLKFSVIRIQMNLLSKMDLSCKGDKFDNSCRVYQCLI